MYYPKSQIKTNLYTYGDEYVIILTQAAYTGYYFLTSTGQAFTGRTPDDRPNQELTKVDPVTTTPLKLPIKVFAVITLPAKLPLASLITLALGVLLEVEAAVKLTDV